MVREFEYYIAIFGISDHSSQHMQKGSLETQANSHTDLDEELHWLLTGASLIRRWQSFFLEVQIQYRDIQTT